MLKAQVALEEKAAGIGKIDNKPKLVGQKYTTEEAVGQLNSTLKAIDEDPKGFKNFPSTLVKQMLSNEYIFDRIKQQVVIAESDPKALAKGGVEVAYGGLTQAISTLVSKAQAKSDEANSYNLPQAVLYVAGRLSEENYKQVLDMVEDYKKVQEMSGDDRVNLAKKTVMVFPGVTKAFIEKDSAMAYLNEPLNSTEKLIKVLFKIAVDLQGDVRPMDVKKFLGDDAAAQGKHMSDALFQRLAIQVQSYSIEDADGKDIVPDSITAKIKENGGKPSAVPDIWTMTHIFHVRQLANKNDPNTSTNLLEANKQETWKALLEREEQNVKEEAAGATGA